MVLEKKCRILGWLSPAPKSACAASVCRGNCLSLFCHVAPIWRKCYLVGRRGDAPNWYSCWRSCWPPCRPLGCYCARYCARSLFPSCGWFPYRVAHSLRSSRMALRLRTWSPCGLDCSQDAPRFFRFCLLVELLYEPLGRCEWVVLGVVEACALFDLRWLGAHHLRKLRRSRVHRFR